MDRELSALDFTARHKLAFDIQGNELTPSARYDFKFKDYAPWVFRDLRKVFQIDAADYLVSLTGKYILSELGSPGKSGSFFYFSRDYRFIIKTLHHAEHKFLRRILPEYHRHIRQYPNTLISQFYGLHRVKTSFGKKIHFVVMNNLFPPHMDIHSTYDVKGSTVGRVTTEDDKKGNPRGTLKDLNWLNSKQYLQLSPEKRDAFLRQIENDVELLARLKIMDYSLLLGIHNMKEVNVPSPLVTTVTPERSGVSPVVPTSPAPLTRTPSVAGQNYRHRDLRRMVTPRDGLVTMTQLQSSPSQASILQHPAVTQPTPSIDRTLNQAQSLPLSSILSGEAGAQQSVGMQHNIFYQFEGGVRSQYKGGAPGEVIYFLGIIDLLTNYGPRKRLENIWKGLGRSDEFKKQISAVPPQRYASRFRDFISGMTKSPDEVRQSRLQRTPSAINLESAMHELQREQMDTKAPDNDKVLRSVQAQDTTCDLVLPVLEEPSSNQERPHDEIEQPRASSDSRRKYTPVGERLQEAVESQGVKRANLDDLQGTQTTRRSPAVSVSSETVLEEIEPDGHDSGLATSLDCLPEESEHSRQSSINRPVRLQAARLVTSDSGTSRERFHDSGSANELAAPFEHDRKDAALLATYKFSNHDAHFTVALPKLDDTAKRQISPAEKAARRRGLIDIPYSNEIAQASNKVEALDSPYKSSMSKSEDDEGYEGSGP